MWGEHGKKESFQLVGRLSWGRLCLIFRRKFSLHIFIISRGPCVDLTFAEHKQSLSYLRTAKRSPLYIAHA